MQFKNLFLLMIIENEEINGTADEAESKYQKRI